MAWITRRRFTPKDDELLCATVQALWPALWEQIAEAMGGKWTARQLRERYNGYLSPHVNHEWTNEDDCMLLALHSKHGHKWAMIAAQLGNRSNVSVRNRFRTLQAQNRGRPPAPVFPPDNQLFDDWIDWDGRC
jgi:hypothetical protein